MDIVQGPGVGARYSRTVAVAPHTVPTDMGMPTDAWGPVFWTAMHVVTLAYPPEPTRQQAGAADAFFRSLAQLLPCPECREHWGELLAASPPATESRDALVTWAWRAHNAVNARLGKRLLSFDAFLNGMRRVTVARLGVPRPGPWWWPFGAQPEDVGARYGDASSNSNSNGSSSHHGAGPGVVATALLLAVTVALTAAVLTSVDRRLVPGVLIGGALAGAVATGLAAIRKQRP